MEKRRGEQLEGYFRLVRRGAKLFIKKLRMGSSLWYILRVVQFAQGG